MAKGALRLKNKLFSGTGLFCYSEFTLFQGKSMYIVDDAQVQTVFYGIHDDMENMALAMYFSELTLSLIHIWHWSIVIGLVLAAALFACGRQLIWNISFVDFSNAEQLEMRKRCV